MSEREELWDAFVGDTAPLVAQLGERLLSLERSIEALGEDWGEVMGLLHTVKGNCGMIRADAGERLAHAMERRARTARDAPLRDQGRVLASLLSSAAGLEEVIGDRMEDEGVRALIDGLDAAEREGDDPAAARRAAAQAVDLAGARPAMSHVRIDADVLDRLLELVGELVICYRRVEARDRADAAPPAARDAGGSSAGRGEALELLGRHIGEMRQRILDARLVPLRVLVTRLRRLVRDLGTATGRPLQFSVEGEDTVVDKSIADQLGEPLMHLIRNAADHGIEDAGARRAAGKPEAGQLELHLAASGAELCATIRDDGRGLSPRKIASAAERRGIDTSGWSERAIQELIFRPDLTTSEEVTRLSGRGVGMPQIRRTIEKMGGEIALSSREGAGTEFSIRLPLAAAMRRTLVMACGANEYAIPIESVVETFRVSSRELYPVDRGWVTSWRDHVLPSRYLAAQLGARDAVHPGPSHLCVVVEDGRRHAGVLVDEISGQQDVLVRDLDPALGRPRGIAGVAIVGEGRVAMVLDPRTLTWVDGREDDTAAEASP